MSAILAIPAIPVQDEDIRNTTRLYIAVEVEVDKEELKSFPLVWEGSNGLQKEIHNAVEKHLREYKSKTIVESNCAHVISEKMPKAEGMYEYELRAKLGIHEDAVNSDLGPNLVDELQRYCDFVEAGYILDYHMKRLR